MPEQEASYGLSGYSNYMQTYTYVSYTHTCIHTFLIHSYIHAYINIDIQTYVYSHIPTYVSPPHTHTIHLTKLNLCNTIRLWSLLPAKAAACCLGCASSSSHRGSEGNCEPGAGSIVSELLFGKGTRLLVVAGRGAGARAGHQADSHGWSRVPGKTVLKVERNRNNGVGLLRLRT